MEVVFKDKELEQVAIGGWVNPKLPIAVCASLQRKVSLLKAAPDERTLRNWKSLHYEKLKGDLDGLHAIRLNDQYRLLFEVSAENAGLKKITVISVADYH
jgi:proteic killer suppression protein